MKPQTPQLTNTKRICRRCKKPFNKESNTANPYKYICGECYSAELLTKLLEEIVELW